MVTGKLKQAGALERPRTVTENLPTTAQSAPTAQSILDIVGHGPMAPDIPAMLGWRNAPEPARVTAEVSQVRPLRQATKEEKSTQPQRVESGPGPSY